jgi:hypothetical protein
MEILSWTPLQTPSISGKCSSLTVTPMMLKIRKNFSHLLNKNYFKFDTNPMVDLGETTIWNKTPKTLSWKSFHAYFLHTSFPWTTFPHIRINLFSHIHSLPFLFFPHKIASIGTPVYDEDLVVMTLNGLIKDYSQFHTSIVVRKTFINFQDLISLLINEKIRIVSVATPLWGKCGVATHTPENGTWESPGTPENSERNYRGQNTLHWGVPYTIEKVFKCRCPKWPCMSHLDIYNTSYGWKKGRESNCQFDSQPLKIRNRPDPGACRWSVTHR